MGIANIINVTGSAGGGDIIRELINSSDGQGLHFDGVAGNVDIASPPDLGTKFSFEFVIKADAWASDTAKRIIDFGTGGRFAIGTNTSDANIKIYDTAWRDFGVSVLDDLKVHHIVITVDGTAAILYDNSNQVGTTTLGANATIDACSDAKIGTYYNGGGGFLNGSIYRCRFYNKTLTQAEVDNAYQNVDIPFADEYGSQANLVTNGTFTGGTTGWGLTSVTYGTNNVVWAAAGGWAYIRQASWNITVGKKYRITYDISGHSANGVLQLWDYGGANTIATLPEITGNGTFTHEFEALKSSSSGVILGKVGSTFVGTMDNVSCVAIGAVTDYDLAFANPTQSLIIQDRAGVADGTASAGISQTQKIVQLNSTSAVVASSAFTPTDGHIVTDCLTLPKAGGTPSLSFDYGSVYNLLDGAVTTSQETTHLAGRNIAFHVNANTANAMSIDSAGLVSIGNVTATKLLHLKSADPVIRLEDSDPDGVYSEIDGAGGDLIISCDGGNGAANSDIMFKVDGSTKMNIDSAGNVQIGTGTLAAVGGGPTLGICGAAPEITLRDSATNTPYAVMRTNDSGNLYLEADKGDNAGASKVVIGSDGADILSFKKETAYVTRGTQEQSAAIAHNTTTTFEAPANIFMIYDTAGYGAVFFNDYSEATVTKIAGASHFTTGGSGAIRLTTASNDSTVTVDNQQGGTRTIKILNLGN